MTETIAPLPPSYKPRIHVVPVRDAGAGGTREDRTDLDLDDAGLDHLVDLDVTEVFTRSGQGLAGGRVGDLAGRRGGGARQGGEDRPRPDGGPAVCRRAVRVGRVPWGESFGC